MIIITTMTITFIHHSPINYELMVDGFFRVNGTNRRNCMALCVRLYWLSRPKDSKRVVLIIMVAIIIKSIP